MPRTGLLVWPALLYLAVCYLVPVYYIARTSLTDPKFGFSNFSAALDSVAAPILFRTMLISVIGCCIVALVGYPVAYVINLSRPWVQRLLLVGVITPYMTSVLIRTFAWQVILGRLGPIPTFLRAIGLGTQSLLQTWTGLTLGIVQIVLPLFILPLVAVMRQVDTNAVRAARSLGAGPAQAFWRVFLPQTLPGVEVGLILSFVSLAGSFVLPVILGGGNATMTGVQINDKLNNEGAWGPASAMAIILAIAIFACIGLLHAGTASRRRWLALRGGQQVRSRGHRKRWARLSFMPVARLLDKTGISRHRWPLYVIVAIIEAYLFLPQLITIPVSFSGTQSLVFPPHSLSLDWYREFGTSQWLEPLLTSFIIAPVCAVVATMLGALAAIGIERSPSRRLRAWSPLLLLAPMAIPIVVVSVGFYLVLVRVSLNDTRLGLILAETTIVVPIAFVVCRASVQSLDPLYERAARSLGARPTLVLRRIVFPLIRPALMVALLFTFLNVFDEVVIPIFVTAVNVTPLPKQLYSSVVFASDPTIAVVGVVSLGLSAVVLLLSIVVGGRKARGGGTALSLLTAAETPTNPT